MQEELKNEAINVLKVWEFIELLSPQEFSNYDKRLLQIDADQDLPWMQKNKPSKGVQHSDQLKTYYYLYLGFVNGKGITDLLIEKYNRGDYVEKDLNGKKCLVAVAILDEQGVIYANDQSAVKISSFPWAFGKIINDKLDDLDHWDTIRSTLELRLLDIFEKGKNKPVTKDMIKKARESVLEVLKIPYEIVIDVDTEIVLKQLQTKEDGVDNPILGSFYLDDLKRAQELIEHNKAPDNLTRYLAKESPQDRINISQDTTCLEKLLQPEKIPAARWPSKGGHPLVLLQQAAVNLIMSEENDGMVGVNGPPGTGKTTLLRDIVAAIVLNRAKEMASFADPETAFKKISLRDDSSNDYYEISDRLKGFEIVIASSNNKAVENITEELPSISAISELAHHIDYFKASSDGLMRSTDTWGMISAVLGNKKNRREFREVFWSDSKIGLYHFLQEKSEDPKKALSEWKNAQTCFLEALKRAEDQLIDLQKIRRIVRGKEAIEQRLGSQDKIRADLTRHDQKRPKFLYRLLRPSKSREWRQVKIDLTHALELFEIGEHFLGVIGDHYVPEQVALSSAVHCKDVHLKAPWCQKRVQQIRDELFIESMKLSKAFIGAAANPLKHNIDLLMRYELGGAIEQNAKDLWASLFIIIPCVSTTFASVSRMFAQVPPDSFGWLLIDEAGQAIPQAAVGAIFRAQHVVATGDPMQIQPVVTLPSGLTEKLFDYHHMDKRIFNPSYVSVQVLVDRTSHYYTEFNAVGQKQTVGFPLLVHRRCMDPMFSISNNIAYGGLMHQAKKGASSPIADCLGVSTWLDVKMQTEQVNRHWSPQEGKQVLSMLVQLKNAGIDLDLYIISPFKSVAQELKQLLKKVAPDQMWLDERVGTVHTVQGREAEAVIFVLGAPGEMNAGARSWAGSTPNILNVAVTRAKEVLYVVGDRDAWKNVGVFKDLCNQLSHKDSRQDQEELKDEFVKEIDLSIEEDKRQKSEKVAKIESEAKDIEDSVAHRYLEENLRIIQFSDHEDIKSHPGFFCSITKKKYPALVIFGRDDQGMRKACQVTYLDEATGNVADISVNKRNFGSVKGAFLTLQEGGRDDPIYLTETIESGLSIQHIDLKGKIVVTLGDYNYKHFPAEAGDYICLCVDDHNGDMSSQSKIEEAKGILKSLGATVSIVRSSSIYGSFNDILKRDGSKSIKMLLDMKKVKEPDRSRVRVQEMAMDIDL